jgi:hypothetical protein
VVRTGLAFGGIGCAVAFAWRGEWLSAGLAFAGVALAVAFWFYGEMADTRAMQRSLMRDALRDVSPSAAGKHRRGIGAPAPQMNSVTGTSAHAAESWPHTSRSFVRSALTSRTSESASTTQKQAF